MGIIYFGEIVPSLLTADYTCRRSEDESWEGLPTYLLWIVIRIENFWGCLMENVYEVGWEAKKKNQLIRRIESKMKEFDTNFVSKLIQILYQSESLLEGSRQKSNL